MDSQQANPFSTDLMTTLRNLNGSIACKPNDNTNLGK